MSDVSRAAIVGALCAGLAFPAFGQSPAAGNATTAPATHQTTTQRSIGTAPSERNTTLTDQGDVRASKLIGSAVYNDHDEKVGSVDDVVLGKDNRADTVVISVGGFLGMGDHYVAVRPSAVKLSYDAKDKKWHATMDANADQLKAAPEYKYPSNT